MTLRTCRAFVLTELGSPLVELELQIPPLKSGQVLVEIAWAGVCHSQLNEARGLKGPDKFLPHCLGHEATGIVTEIGPGVSRAKVGDRVLLSWIKANGIDAGGTVYESKIGPVNAGAITTFQTLAVVSENRVTKLAPTLTLQEGALLGCAIPTGYGAVRFDGMLQAGESVVICGCGGVGIVAIQAAAEVTDEVAGVDIVSFKLERAADAGAKYLIDGSIGRWQSAVLKQFPQGVDLLIEATGSPEVMSAMLEVVKPRRGRVVLVGNAPAGSTIALDPTHFNQGKKVLGSWGGGVQPDRDFGELMGHLERRRHRFASFLASVFELSELNDALESLRNGNVLRPLVKLSGVL